MVSEILNPDTVKIEFQEQLALTLAKNPSEYDDIDKKTLTLEWINCSKSFLTFLKYCKLVVPPSPNEPGSGGIRPFELWGHTKKIIHALMTQRLIIILKSRQIGASWICAAWDLWYALFHYGAVVMLYSKGELEAAEKLNKCRQVYNHLPVFLVEKANPDSQMAMEFPVMHSKLLAMPSTPSAGISFTASILDCDEWEEHPYANEHYAAAKPVIDAGGQFIGTFTRNYNKSSSLARSVYVGAREKKNSFFPLFFPYNVRPGRDEVWYEARKGELTTNELEGLTPELYMMSNYPRSEKEALGHARSIMAFDIDALSWMMGEVRNPIKIDSIDNNIIHIFKQHTIGNYYIASTDTAHGVGKDYSVTVVLNAKTGEVVADIMHNRISEEELALQSINMLKLYQSPLWFIEDNDWGRSVILAAQRLGYKNLGYQDKDKKKPGYKTSGGETGRDSLWGSLIPAINNKQVLIYNKQGLAQFYDVIRNSDKNGRIEATSGGHDDYPMALAIAWYKKDQVQTEKLSYKPIQSLHF